MNPRIALAQHNFLVGDLDGNAAKIRALITEARDRLQADAIVFPELALSGYPPEDLLLRPSFKARANELIDALADAARGIVAIVGFPHLDDGRLFNAAAVLRDGRIAGIYHKHDLPNYAVFDEKRYFAAGRAPLVVDIAGVAFGVVICEDVWQAEPAQAAQRAGAQALLALNASPYAVDKHPERVAALDEHVGALGLPAVYLNLIGGQDELVFDGGSFLYAPKAPVEHVLKPFGEDLACVVFNSANRRFKPDSGDWCAPLEGPEQLYAALELGVRDYVNKNRFSGVLLGLSGGIDSALTAAIAADALGPDRVHAVMLPYRYTAQLSLDEAAHQAQLLGIHYQVLPIEAPVQGFLDVLSGPFAGRATDTTEENLQSRCRGVLLMALSNKLGPMLLSTGNKSEMAVGYSTIYGDMCGGFAPLKDVYKMNVFALARWRNTQGSVIPEVVIDRPPSAELRADQKDEDSLPPYPVLDAILERYVDQERSAESIIAEGFARATVERVVKLVLRNEYKRRQAPPGVRVTRKAFGRDRRYPITSGWWRDR
jgi:NAD+ synthase (glutamine-hydrolysing)